MLAGCGSSGGGSSTGGGGGGSGDTTGSGATFPAAAYTRWGRDSGYASYQAKGSGAGIQDLINGLVQWAGSDAPMTEQEQSAMASKRGGATPVYFPTLLGAVSVPANVSGATKPLKIESAVIGDIFAGTVTKWNDPKIASTNAGVSLPDQPIVVCVRADSSATSYNFSRYLARESPDFKAKVGEGNKTPAWGAPNLVKQPGNPGVAQCVKSNDNSIGYVDLGDARQAGLKDKLVEVGVNGTFTAPSVATIQAAGASAPEDPALIIDPGSQTPPKGYPITVTTWIIAYSDYTKAKVKGAMATQKWLQYVYSSGAQQILPTFGFAPLPQGVKAQAAKNIPNLQGT